MKNDPIEFCINMYCPDSLLLWLLIISFLVTLITGAGLIKINSFLVDVNGNRSVRKLQSIRSLTKMKAHLNSLSNNDLLLVRKHLMLDFIFIPFFYLLLHSTTVLQLRHSIMGAGWHTLLYFLSIVPFAALLFDVVENSMTLSIVGAHQQQLDITRSQATGMFLFSRLKWAFLGVCLLGIVSFIISSLVDQIK